MTDTYILQRLSDSGQETFGQLQDANGNILCVTIERPWLNNAQDVSCVPPGIYDFYRYDSPTKGFVWRTDEVPGRTAIEIHIANRASELLGCIAPGKSIGQIDGVPAVLDSEMAFNMLQSILPDKFPLQIIGVST